MVSWMSMKNHSNTTGAQTDDAWSNGSSLLRLAENTLHQICWHGDDDDDVFFAKLSLAVCQSLTLVLAFVYAIAIYKKIDIAHPVFAVVFQEVLVMCFSASVCFVPFLFTMASYYKCWFVVLFHKVTLLLLQFHQSSWLVVTCLRYYLIVVADPEEINMRRLKSISLIAVWFLFLLGLLTTGATFFLVKNYWIIEMNEAIYRNLSSTTKFLIQLAYISPANIPDLISIIFYFKLLRHLYKRAVQVDVAGPPVVNDSHQSNPPAIIERENNSRSSNNSSSSINSNDSDVINMNNLANMGNNGGNSHNNQPNNETQLILRSLTTHVAVALFDMSLPFSMFIPNMAAQHFVLVHLLLTFSFWAPMLVIWRNFRQMGKMVKFYFDLVCT